MANELNSKGGKRYEKGKRQENLSLSESMREIEILDVNGKDGEQQEI